MTFHEWCEVSEKVIGEAGMLIFNKFVRGEISFEECLKGLYAAIPLENMMMLKKMMEIVNKEDVNTVSKKHILHSIYPKYREDYEGSQCWHGCDKVSIIHGSGGGGS